jgi:thiamine-monophosphate kinase
MKEADVISRVRAIFDQTPNPTNLIIPNGDDGAVFQATESQVVVSTDIAVEDVHFRTEWSAGAEIGAKITAANLADICAMGARPTYLLVSVAFPKSYLAHLEDIAKGIFSECSKVGAKVIGGDISTAEKLVISITALGETSSAITRSGAKVNDLVMISNLPGWSAAGLLALEKSFVSSALAQKSIKQHCAPAIDYEKYCNNFSKFNAATDISDGLLLDAANIAAASGLAISLESAEIRKTESYQELKNMADQIMIGAENDVAMNWVLTGGEDHVLLVTGSEPIPGFWVIGKAIPGSGIYLDGKKVETTDSGFQHRW